MDDLFINFNCDKGSYCVYDYEKKITHKYSVFYEKYLKKNKKKKLSILELGSHEGKGIASFYFFFPKHTEKNKIIQNDMIIYSYDNWFFLWKFNNSWI